MTNVKPEHIKQAGYLFGMAINANIDVQPDWLMIIAQLYADLDAARADARVLAEELDRARLALEGRGENVGVEVTVTTGPRPHLSMPVHPERLADWKKARAATDASGALERSRP